MRLETHKHVNRYNLDPSKAYNAYRRTLVSI